MNKHDDKRKIAISIFSISFALITLVFIISIVRTHTFNSILHKDTFEAGNLFVIQADESKDVSVKAEASSATWTKVFDFNSEGLEEHNYQAYTYDFYISNNTKDEVSYYQFKLTFNDEAYLMSAWNGSLEVHQKIETGENAATVNDLRELGYEKYALETVVVDGETLITIRPGDYFIYYPSSDLNSMEIPIEPYEGTTPGLILYVPIGKDINNAKLEIEYKFHRVLKNELLFWEAVVGFAVWSIALLIYVITYTQIRKYKIRHERDNEIIKESIETFTGFIDAKDPYTNGHSNRVAQYTRMIAEKMGYEGEDLDRIYYVALLHDCGKIGVPDNVLGKPSRLTDEEYEIIKSHTVRGGMILNHFKSMENVGEGALYHHERYDGNGYPEGKKGEEIPLIARMICVADSFDAMNSNRVYRKKLTKEDIFEEIEKNKGKQFDPKIADVFLELIKEDKIEVG